MITYAFALFIFLHGLVHLLYFGHSQGHFQLKEDFTWPQESWILSRIASPSRIKRIASIACILSAVGYILGATCLLLMPQWTPLIILITSAFSSVSYLVLWDGQLKRLPDQGAIGILINAAIVIVLFKIL